MPMKINGNVEERRTEQTTKISSGMSAIPTTEMVRGAGSDQDESQKAAENNFECIFADRFETMRTGFGRATISIASTRITEVESEIMAKIGPPSHSLLTAAVSLIRLEVDLRRAAADLRILAITMTPPRGDITPIAVLDADYHADRDDVLPTAP